MKYPKVRKAEFIVRDNRFVAHVRLDGEETAVHVKNTGRCRELLLPGSTVYLADSEAVEGGGKRKYRYDCIAVERKLADGRTVLINFDSGAPNVCAGEWLRESAPFGQPTVLRPETFYGDSRFDFYMETASQKYFIEVKGVTLLEDDGMALFPDAPTLRGLKHVNGLAELAESGYGAAILFVIQFTGARAFSPNVPMQPEFARALRAAEARGVKILAAECEILPDEMRIKGCIPVVLPDI